MEEEQGHGVPVERSVLDVVHEFEAIMKVGRERELLFDSTARNIDEEEGETGNSG